MFSGLTQAIMEKHIQCFMAKVILLHEDYCGRKMNSEFSRGLDEQYRTQQEKEITLSVLSCFQESVAENKSLCLDGASASKLDWTRSVKQLNDIKQEKQCVDGKATGGGPSSWREMEQPGRLKIGYKHEFELRSQSNS